MSTDRPILFSGPMVRALLAGTKTQTRRAVKPQPPADTFQVSTWHHPSPRPHFYAWEQPSGLESVQIAPDWCRPCPYGAPGNRLWVRETWAHDARSLEECRAAYEDLMGSAGYGPYYRATEVAPDTLTWRPSIHMPRWVSRITLEITAVRVERLQDISRGDAMAEGCPFPNMAQGPDPRQWYAELWGEINGAESWAANPWVWVVEFKPTVAEGSAG